MFGYGAQRVVGSVSVSWTHIFSVAALAKAEPKASVARRWRLLRLPGSQLGISAAVFYEVIRAIDGSAEETAHRFSKDSVAHGTERLIPAGCVRTVLEP